MADISITAASVVPGSNATVLKGTAGAPIAAGDALYLDSNTGTLKLCDANLSAAAATFRGIAVCDAASGQPILFVSEDAAFGIGATVAAGTVLVVSATAGKICPAADIATGMFVTVLGVMAAGNKLVLKPSASGVAAA